MQTLKETRKRLKRLRSHRVKPLISWQRVLSASPYSIVLCKQPPYPSTFIVKLKWIWKAIGVIVNKQNVLLSLCVRVCGCHATHVLHSSNNHFPKAILFAYILRSRHTCAVATNVLILTTSTRNLVNSLTL